MVPEPHRAPGGCPSPKAPPSVGSEAKASLSRGDKGLGDTRCMLAMSASVHSLDLAVQAGFNEADQKQRHSPGSGEEGGAAVPWWQWSPREP